jgi:hypothetical protein
MSSAFYIVLEDDEPGFDTQVGGKALSREEEAINKIAWDLKVTPLMEFYSVDTEGAMDLMEYEGDPSKAEIPETQWFDPEEGLKTVQALLHYISDHPNVVQNPGPVIDDLKDFEGVLEQAIVYGLHWHLSVDY